MTIENIEDLNRKPTPVWMMIQPSSAQWEPCRPADCQRLNQEVAAERTTTVLIEGGRSTVDLSTYRVKYNYIRGKERKIQPCVWFLQKLVHKKVCLVPLELEDDQAIEKFYQDIIQVNASNREGLLDRKITLTDNSTVSLSKKEGTSYVLLRKTSWLQSPIPLQRGYGSYTVRGEDEDTLMGPVTHVVFVVHGIGEALFSRDEMTHVPSLIEQTQTLNTDIQQRQIQKWREDCKRHQKQGKPPPLVPNRVEFVPIEWFAQIHDDRIVLTQQLKKVTLPTIPALRAIANDVIFDVLLYLTPNFCRQVLECVLLQIETLYTKVKEIHPQVQDFSLIGHSLGSVIVWDLLTLLSEDNDSYQNAGPNLPQPLAHKLPFIPTSTIFLGSPLGMFLTMRNATLCEDDTEGVSTFQLPTQSLYNIFHPSDPVAYRIEPLLLPLKSPVPEPDYLVVPGQQVRLHVKAKQLTTAIGKSLVDVQSSSWGNLLESAVSVLSETTTTMNDNSQTKAIKAREAPTTFPLGGKSSRVDFSLQPGVIDNEYISAVLAHSTATYFGHTDFQDFLLALYFPGKL